MPHAFDSTAFGELASAAERLATGASRHEERLTQLVETLDRDLENGLLETLRALCVEAREQRLIADSIRAHVIGHRESADGNRGRRPLVLIVDDSPDNRDMAAMLLETSGFDTITAGNGLEGVIAAHYTRPSLVIMDVAMPVLDGVQAARLLKASQATHDINVIAYTAKMKVDDAPDRLFVDVLQKPASPDAIIGLVQRFALAIEPEAI